MSQQPEDDADDFDPMEVYTMEDFMEEDAILDAIFEEILEEFTRELGEELKANIDGESSTVTRRHRRHSRSKRRRYVPLYLYVRFYKKNYRQSLSVDRTCPYIYLSIKSQNFSLSNIFLLPPVCRISPFNICIEQKENKIFSKVPNANWPPW